MITGYAYTPVIPVLSFDVTDVASRYTRFPSLDEQTEHIKPGGLTESGESVECVILIHNS